MKNIFSIFMLFSIIALFASCEKDEGKLPNISFKTGGVYTSANATLFGGSLLTIGINASKAEDKDVLKKFTISKSINGATPLVIYTEDLSGAQGDTYAHDYIEVLTNTSQETDVYTFTVTNRDGLTNQITITITVS
jgi:VCBS repeat-containing protein